MRKVFIISAAVILLIGAAIFIGRGYISRQFFKPTPTALQEGIKIDAGPKNTEGGKNRIFEVIAENLQVPWEIAFLPQGDILVTERPGTLRRIGKDKKIYSIEGVEHVGEDGPALQSLGEGGLLGMALHPNFADNRWIYLYLTTKVDGGLKNRVERYRLDDDRLSEKKIIIDNIPGAAYHDGGRIAFGLDSYLYITTGDSGNSNLAQDINSLAGKILRLKDDGSISDDNPFGNAVFSYGHRNPQGIAWDNQGRLWATEHGRSGVLSGFDELNLIEKGKNYGWPVIQGDEKKEGMVSPIVQSGADETWAPAGLAFYNDSLFFGGLRGESFYEAKIIDDNKVSLKAHFRQEFGRIRAAVLGPDGYLYITTSNTDGRGEPRQGDDKIIKVNPALFQSEDANNLQPQNSGDVQKEQKVPAEIFPAKTAEEKSILQNVPFVPQAPLGNWQDERQENACEEASALMATRWAENRKLTLEEAEKEIIAISEYERNNFGDFHDTSAADTVERIFKGYFGYENVELRNNIGIGDIKQEIFAGNVLIVPVNGRKLRNPYYTPPGPIEHQLVIIGYDEAAKEFVVNDPGTRRGEKYRYPENIIEQALQDYPTGFHEPIEKINKTMIIVKRRP